ncbi:MAG: DUF502 domain-containing protein [Candidatus Marinimicrobia bacterium]|nr:DUF502 domain-containing protein [Candidatus Neomarinimicrobiota bacterium]
MKTDQKTIWQRLRNKLLTGIITLVPLYITFVLVKFSIEIAPDLPILNEIEFLEEHPFLYELLGFLIAIGITLVLGFVVSNVLGNRLFKLFERIMKKLPLVGTIYNSSRQILQTLALSGKGNFKEVVYVEYPKKEAWTLAFVTAYSKNKLGEQYIHLFVPTTPNPTSGVMIFVKKTLVLETEMTVEEGLKTLISGGMIAPEENNLP